MSENLSPPIVQDPTIEDAVLAARDLISRMADSVRITAGSSASINGQNLPNEIRALKGESPVTKTYYDMNHYLYDIGQIILPDAERSPGETINAQDFPQLIRTLDNRYLAPNGQKYYYKYTYSQNLYYQSTVFNVEYYFNKPFAAYNSKWWIWDDSLNAKHELGIVSANVGVYTNITEYVRYVNPTTSPDSCPDYCMNVTSGANGYQINPYPSYPPSTGDIPSFNNESDLIAYLTEGKYVAPNLKPYTYKVLVHNYGNGDNWDLYSNYPIGLYTSTPGLSNLYRVCIAKDTGLFACDTGSNTNIVIRTLVYGTADGSATFSENDACVYLHNSSTVPRGGMGMYGSINDVPIYSNNYANLYNELINS